MIETISCVTLEFLRVVRLVDTNVSAHSCEIKCLQKAPPMMYELKQLWKQEVAWLDFAQDKQSLNDCSDHGLEITDVINQGPAEHARNGNISGLTPAS